MKSAITNLIVNRKSISLILFGVFLLCSCKKLLDIETPKAKIERSLIFTNDVTATAVMLGVYSNMNSFSSFSSGGTQGISSLAGLSGDELIHFMLWDINSIEFQNNELSSMNPYIESWWQSLYSSLYNVNAIIEGLSGSSGLTEQIKNQLTGEAYFMRAFCNFYLVNLFGDVPLCLTTDYQKNMILPRAGSQEIYKQITADLQIAIQNLSDEYITRNKERIRPNKSAAIALASRVALYGRNWNEAESLASNLIDSIGLYNLETDLSQVFLKNSAESIWQISPASGANTSTGATSEGSVFSPDNVIYYNVLNTEVVRSYEPADQRLRIWIDTLFSGTDTIYYPRKYKQSQSSDPLTEYSMVFRLAEQYFIRAEARAMLGKLVGNNSAESDINIIRNRAELSPTTASTQDELLAAIDHERRAELFTEWGHRWFDLKRRKKSDDILSLKKGNTWQSNDTLFPIPLKEINKNPNLKPQNPGY